jgi:hypothetical protein
MWLNQSDLSAGARAVRSRAAWILIPSYEHPLSESRFENPKTACIRFGNRPLQYNSFAFFRWLAALPLNFTDEYRTYGAAGIQFNNNPCGFAASPEALFRADKKHYQCFLSGINIITIALIRRHCNRVFAD